MLPIHDPDYETTLRDGRLLADQMITKLQLRQLEYLDLSWSSVRGPELQSICKLLSEDKCVRHILMNGYGYGTTEVLKVISAIQNSKLVETLNLSYCGLDDQAAKSLGLFLKNNKSIRRLNLTLNAFTRVGFEAVVEGLQQNSGVKGIDLQLADLEKLEELDYFFERVFSDIIK